MVNFNNNLRVNASKDTDGETDEELDYIYNNLDKDLKNWERRRNEMKS